MNRRVIARITVMMVTIVFIGGFSAMNPDCATQTHASDIDRAPVTPDITSETPLAH